MVSHRWREMAARHWSVTPVRSHGKLTQHGRKCTFFSFFSPPLLNDGQQRSGDGHQGRPNQPHISAKSHLLDRNSLPPTQDPSGSRKGQLTANCRTFSNRCCSASFALKCLTLGPAFTATLPPLLRAAFGKQPVWFYAFAQYDKMALNSNHCSIYSHGFRVIYSALSNRLQGRV